MNKLSSLLLNTLLRAPPAPLLAVLTTSDEVGSLGPHLRRHGPVRRSVICCFCLLHFSGAVRALPDPKPALTAPDEAYRLVDHDEFDGAMLDWNAWHHEPTSVDRTRGVYRGPENVQVKNGELHLLVTKEARLGSIWSAASIYRAKPIENGAYVECRFKPTSCSGVNNAFWLTCRPFDTGGISNRYEVDVVETRLDAKTGLGKAHLAWHDWKGISYIRDSHGKPGHIAQGIQVEHEWNAYQVWGYQIEDGMMRWFLNGKLVWEGSTHDKYPAQYRTGVGKFSSWFPQKEREAYGRFGQASWDYRGGYAGDRLNVVLSTMPWGDATTPLDDKANNTSMAVDYVRIFMPERLLNTTPLTTLPFTQGKVRCPPLFKDTRRPKYYGVLLDTTAGSDFKLGCFDAKGQRLLTIGSKNRMLTLAAGTNQASTASVMASPWEEFTQAHAYKGPMQLILRLTPTRMPGTSIASICLFPATDPNFTKEPLWYHNVDDQGNTSVNNRWHLNLLMTLRNDLAEVAMDGNATARTLRMALNYLAAWAP